jgi:hypothetical protein
MAFSWQHSALLIHPPIATMRQLPFVHLVRRVLPGAALTAALLLVGCASRVPDMSVTPGQIWGQVESVQMERGDEQRSSTPVQVSVRMDTGEIRRFQLPAGADVHAGERVRVDGEKLLRY